MAIVFELSVHFGADAVAAHQFVKHIKQRYRSLPDVDRFDLTELRSDYQDEIMDGSMHGLVIARTLRPVLPSSSHFVPFDESHDWIPYRGTHALT